jgi:cation transport regulator ChaB
MPWTADDKRIRSLPKVARELWVKVANAYIKTHGDDEESAVSAIRIAWSAVDKAGYKKGEGGDSHKWVGGSADGAEGLMKSFQPFSAPLSFVKTETRNGKPYIILKASGPKVDRQGERMSDGALDKMIKKAKSGGIELLDNHYGSFDMGKSDDGWLDSSSGELHFGIVGNTKNPFMPMLLDEIQSGDCNKHTSVGGAVLDAHWEYDQSLGKAVRVLDDIDADHVALTRHNKSAYPFKDETSFVGAIMKQLDLPTPAEKEGEKMEKKGILDLLKKAAEAGEALLKSLAASVTVDMFQKTETGFTLKKEFEGVLQPSEVLTQEEKAEFGKSLETICKALGVPLKKSEHNPDSVEGDTGADGGTGKDGKVEGRAKKDPKKQGDGAEPAAGADGPGTDGPSQGNGSAAEKAVMDSLMKGMQAELVTAQANIGALLKDHTTTRDELLKATLEVSEMKKNLAAMEKTALTARPVVGQERLVQKDVADLPTRPAEDLEKSGSGSEEEKAEKFVKSLEAQSASMLKAKGSKGWSEEEAKKAHELGEKLKVAKAVGYAECYKRFSPKDEEKK